MNRSSRLLLSAALLVFLVGVGLAIAKPGSLDESNEETAAPTATSTTIAAGVVTDPVTTDPVITDPATPTSEGIAGEGPTDTSGTAPTSTTPTTPTDVTTSTTQAGSGLGTSGTADPTDTAGGLADTGGESMILAGIVLGGLGLVGSRRRRNLD